MRSLANIFWLGTKELRSFLQDYFLVGLSIFAFSLMIYAQAQSRSQELYNGAIAIIDEDNSPLSRYVIEGFYLPPYFRPPHAIALRDVNRLMDNGRYTFIVDIPLHFERDVLAGRQPAIQVNVDATAVIHAGIGAEYIQQILTTQINDFLARTERLRPPPVNLAIRVAFNSNLMSSWFLGVMGILNNVTMLTIILSGAAVVRESEHGTMDHLLVMPLRPSEIVLSKVWANGLVILLVVGMSLSVVLHGLLAMPIAGSVSLFLAGVALYLFFATAIGIFLATIARTMPQFGLLFILVAVPIIVLSGSTTPLESMPWILQAMMQFSPSTHFVSFAQAILYRGAGIGIVWPEFAAVAFMGGLFFGLALLRFRRVSAQTT